MGYIVKLYDGDKLIFEGSKGNFKNFCKENNFSYKKLLKTSKTTKIKDLELFKYASKKLRNFFEKCSNYWIEVNKAKFFKEIRYEIENGNFKTIIKEWYEIKTN